MNLVFNIQSKVEQIKSDTDALQNVPIPAINRILNELNLKDNELIYKNNETSGKKSTGNRAIVQKVKTNTMRNYLGKLLMQF